MIACLKCTTAHKLFVGELREQVEDARRITEDQKVVLDKIKRVHRFFEHLDVLCNSVKEVRYSPSLQSLLVLIPMAGPSVY